ncbi:hypothetical protein FB45DRAFT_1013863 [Roridomyces roridus]|uniref:F-box domain-containing protein n=1 Tax=Roridomyces roridus TaxID=1738132 RepID=A0AAD7F8T9_9AGAR|nr:hypothetical protein FB45DRAFT_1013863 [Roridomyces roridus]
MNSAAFNFRSPSRSPAGPGNIPPPGQEMMMASASFNFRTPATSRSVDILPNAMVSEDDCRRIHGLLVDAREGVALLTSQLAGMNVSSYGDKRKLIARRNRLTEFIDAQLAAVSVTRRIPEDVLREIFLECLSFDEPHSLDPNEAPLVLCRISQEWRRLAMSMPLLWMAITIGSLTQAQTEKMQQIADAAKEWLSRSGTLPLTIAFMGQPRIALVEEPGRIPVGTEISHLLGASHDSPIYDPLLRALMVFAPRWKSFKLHVSHSTHLRSLVDWSPKDAPILKSVSIHCDTLRGREKHWHLPFLSAATITSVYIYPNILGYLNSIPWETVLHLTLRGGYSLSLIRRCALLETCTLHGLSSAYAEPSGPVHLEHLHTLCIGDGDPSNFQSSRSFYRSSNLILPNLRRLEYRKNHGWARENLAIEPVLESCALTLRSLDLTVCMSMTAFVNAVQAAKHLEELTIQSEPSTYAGEVEHVFVPLTPALASPASVLCLRLRSLTLLNFGSKISDEVLLQFIRARTDPEGENEGLAKLGSVKARLNRERQLDVVALLEDRIAEGLVLDLGYVRMK